MPRKSKQQKQTITVVVNNQPVTVILHPPTGIRKSWYAYWNGLVASKSTGQADLQEAIQVVEAMLRNDGRRPTLETAAMSNEEFEEIQKAHFSRITDAAAQRRAKKTLESCLDAIAAFREITGIATLALATPDECARFQRVALTLPKKWRLTAADQRLVPDQYTEEQRRQRTKLGQPHPLDARPTYSPNNVLKWSRTLQAAYERVNRNAQKRKTVRGVVADEKLLTANPWSQFRWIEGRKKVIRQFNSEELVAFLDHFETAWEGVSVIPVLAKVFLWSSGRRLEMASLQWSSYRPVGDEHHFHVVGKWGVEKWFRIPTDLFRELEALKSDSDFVFAAYGPQLRDFYLRTGEPGKARNVLLEFDPENLANWFYKKVKAWSASLPKGHATTHIFRKTSLQYARTGEDINRAVAEDARVTPSVMMTNYAQELDPEMRARSNRTFQRIQASLTPQVARRYGHDEVGPSDLERRLQAAVAAKDWLLAQELTALLSGERRQPEAG